jgi:hypothetical protein
LKLKKEHFVEISAVKKGSSMGVADFLTMTSPGSREEAGDRVRVALESLKIPGVDG